MPNIKHILFPIDFSDRCCSAVPFVEAMASRYQAKITLLSAALPIIYAGIGDPGGPIVDTGTLLGELQERLDNTLTRQFANFHVDRVVELGDPAQMITSYAHKHAVDLIMMPTHGYGPFRRFLLGSVTAKVLHDVHCPVWTAAHVDEKPCRDHLACRKILCAIDATPKSVALMKWAADLARDLGASLHLTHAVPATDWYDSRDAADFLDGARQVIGKLQESAGVDAPLCVIRGDVAFGVEEEARRHRSDLVIIGRGVAQETLGRLRTHSYGIIRQSVCPVISV
jgi:nucleotide-binding universal stress UspA family protein